MGLLTPTPPATSLTPAQAQVRDAVLALTRRTWKTMVQAQNDGIDMLWAGRTLGLHGLTPQQAIDALGEDAAKLFAFHGALTDFLAAWAAYDGETVALKSPTNAFEVNVDGTVTVDPETPYTP